jgi:hypothetical protein
VSASPDAGAAPDAGPIDFGPEPDSGAIVTGTDGGRAPTRLLIRIVDSNTRKRLPGMVSLWNLDTGKMLTFGIRVTDDGTPSMGATTREVGSGGALATWHGLGIWRGEADVLIGVDWPVEVAGKAIGKERIPFGRYRLVAARGPEYELSEARVELGPDQGPITVELPLARTVDTSGYVAADMHIHAAPGSGDARLTNVDRVKTLAVAGVEVGVSADHDFITDLGAAVRELWPPGGDAPPVATVIGNEASYWAAGRPVGHFNVFPLVLDSSKLRNGGANIASDTAPAKVFEILRTTAPTAAIIQLNHARLGYAAYFDDPTCQGWLDRSKPPGCPLDIDAIEVLNGYLVCGTAIENALKDWYALLGFGRMLVATGNSDSHGTSLILAGFPRTYVRMGDDRVEAFTSDEFISALRSRRAIATTGPFLTLRASDGLQEGAVVAAPGGVVNVSFRMQAASWVLVDEVLLKVDGKTIKSWPVPRVGGATPLLEVTSEPVAVTSEAFITVEARSTKALPPFVVGDKTSDNACPPLPGADKGMVPFAVTNPLYVDYDGDGRWRGVRAN